MCAITNPTRITPVTAITTFLPTIVPHSTTIGLADQNPRGLLDRLRLSLTDGFLTHLCLCHRYLNDGRRLTGGPLRASPGTVVPSVKGPRALGDPASALLAGLPSGGRRPPGGNSCGPTILSNYIRGSTNQFADRKAKPHRFLQVQAGLQERAVIKEPSRQRIGVPDASFCQRPTSSDSMLPSTSISILGRRLLARAELSPHAFERPDQANAQRVGGDANSRRNLRPWVARGPSLCDDSLLFRQPLLHGFEKVVTVHRRRRIRARIDQARFARGGRAVPPLIPAGGLFPQGVVRHPVPCHRRQQRDQLLGTVQLELPVGRAYKKLPSTDWQTSIESSHRRSLGSVNGRARRCESLARSDAPEGRWPAHRLCERGG